MISNPLPQSKDLVIIQRSDDNTIYEEVHASGSLVIPYLNADGHLDFDTSQSFYTLFPPAGATSVDTASWAINSISSSIIPYNGNRAIKRDDPDFQGINVGGLDVVSFLDNFFFPFIPATISITAGQPYYETGSSQNIIIAATVTANDEVSFGSGSIKRDGSVIYTDPAIPPLSFAYTDIGVVVNHSYIGYAQTNNDGSPTVIVSGVKTPTFVYPYLYGLSTNPGLIGNTLYTTLSKNIYPFGNKTYSYTGINTYLYFAYPSSYGSLTEVLDPNLFQVLTSFYISSSITVISSGLTFNWSHPYEVYRWKTLADFTGGNYQFSYTPI